MTWLWSQILNVDNSFLRLCPTGHCRQSIALSTDLNSVLLLSLPVVMLPDKSIQSRLPYWTTVWRRRTVLRNIFNIIFITRYHGMKFSHLFLVLSWYSLLPYRIHPFSPNFASLSSLFLLVRRTAYHSAKSLLSKSPKHISKFRSRYWVFSNVHFIVSSIYSITRAPCTW